MNIYDWIGLRHVAYMEKKKKIPQHKLKLWYQSSIRKTLPPNGTHWLGLGVKKVTSNFNS